MTGDTTVREMFTELREIVAATPRGPIVAEFETLEGARDCRDQLGADSHRITGGITRVFAVRRLL